MREEEGEDGMKEKGRKWDGGEGKGGWDEEDAKGEGKWMGGGGDGEARKQVETQKRGRENLNYCRLEEICPDNSRILINQFDQIHLMFVTNSLFGSVCEEKHE